jgi:hypothetical protein
MRCRKFSAVRSPVMRPLNQYVSRFRGVAVGEARLNTDAGVDVVHDEVHQL